MNKCAYCNKHITNDSFFACQACKRDQHPRIHEHNHYQLTRIADQLERIASLLEEGITVKK